MIAEGINNSYTSHRLDSSGKVDSRTAQLAGVNKMSSVPIFADFSQNVIHMGHCHQSVRKPGPEHFSNGTEVFKQEQPDLKLQDCMQNTNSNSNVNVLKSVDKTSADKVGTKNETVIQIQRKRGPARPPGNTRNVKTKRLENHLDFFGRTGNGLMKISNDNSQRWVYEEDDRNSNGYLEWLKKCQEKNRADYPNQIFDGKNGLSQGPLIPNGDRLPPPYPMTNGTPCPQQQMHMVKLSVPPAQMVQTFQYQQHTVPQNLVQITPTNEKTNNVSLRSVGQQNFGQCQDANVDKSVNNCIVDLSWKPVGIHENIFEVKNCYQQDDCNLDLLETKRLHMDTFNLQTPASQKEKVELRNDSELASWDVENVAQFVASIPDCQKEKVELRNDSELASWDVENVAQFVASIPDCQDYADVFREHRIDGSTLPHLSEEHLVNFVKMKLGPAIRLLLEVQRLTKRN